MKTSVLWLSFFALTTVGGTEFYGVNRADYSGSVVEISSNGNVLAIGAPNHKEGAGQVRLYQREEGGEWSQRGSEIVGALAKTRAGSAIALSETGNIVAIGSPHADGQRGQVHVYQWRDEAWAQLGQALVGEALQDFFGCSLAISADGQLLAVGARLNDKNGDNAGHVQNFSWSQGRWIPRGSPVNGESEYDGSGFSISLSSNGLVLAVGAPANRAYKGHVRTFRWHDDSQDWIQQGSSIIGDNEFDFLGWGIDLSANGDVMAVGSPYHNSNNLENAGQVKVFHWLEGDWRQLGDDLNGQDERGGFGNAVVLSPDGATVVIASSQGKGAKGLHAGNVRLFQLSDANGWIESDSWFSGESEGERFGHALSLSSHGTLVVGVRQSNNNAGHVETFELFESMATS